MARLLIIPLALIGLLAGAMVWSGTGFEERADFSFINRGDILTLDTNQMSYLQDFRMARAMWEGLYSYDPQTLEPVPGCASSVEISPDKRLYVFHLRPEARWSNGDRVTTRDFVFAWRRMLESPAEYTYLHFYIKGAEQYETDFQKHFQTLGAHAKWEKDRDGAEPVVVPLPDFRTVGIEAPDDLTLRVSLENPVTFLLDLVAFGPFYPQHEKSMEPFKVIAPDGRVSYDQEFTRPPNVVSNGPFKLVQWDFKRRLLLKQNEHYWDQPHVKSKSIEMVVVEDALTQFKRYDFGKVDWLADVPSELAPDLVKTGRADMHVFQGFGTTYMNVNCKPLLPGGMKNPMFDKRVRRALGMSIDKKSICETITRLGEIPAANYIPPGIFPGYHGSPGPAFDIPAAKKLLAEAGYPDGKGFPKLTMLFRSDRAATREMVQNLAKQWRDALNIDVDLESVEAKVYRKRSNEQDYMLCPGNWIGDYMDPSTFTDKYRSNSENNDSKWANAEYDDLLNQAMKESDAEKRMHMLERAEAILNDEAPVLPLYYVVNAYMFRDNVKGLNLDPRSTIIFKTLGVERTK